MDVHLLEDIGLTKAQSLIYTALIEHGTVTAAEIAKITGESRTNSYKVLDKLCELKLAIKSDSGKKQQYTALSPAALEEIARQKTAEAQHLERKVGSELPRMIEYYFAHSEQPVVRYFQGTEGMRAMYFDQIAEGKPVHFIRSMRDLDHFGPEELHKIRNLFPANKIPRHAITQDIPAPTTLNDGFRIPIAESDRLMMLTRTWIELEDYDEPVEWSVYGDKLSITSFGEDVSGIIIQNQQIADSFRRIYKLLDEGIRRRPDYASYPHQTLDTRAPVAAKLTGKLKR